MSVSFSLADMDMIYAVTDCRFDCRIERPSWEDMVFWRETGTKDDEDDVEVREGVFNSVATDMITLESRPWCSTAPLPQPSRCPRAHDAMIHRGAERSGSSAVATPCDNSNPISSRSPARAVVCCPGASDFLQSKEAVGTSS